MYWKGNARSATEYFSAILAILPKNTDTITNTMILLILIATGVYAAKTKTIKSSGILIIVFYQ